MKILIATLFAGCLALGLMSYEKIGFFSNLKHKDEFVMSTDTLDLQEELYHSVRYRNIEALSKILAEGVSPNIMISDPFADSGEILLILSLLNATYADNEDLTEHAKVIELLLQNGADITARNENGLGVFHLAASNRRTDVIDMLLLSGADPDMKDKYGQSALFYANSTDIFEAFSNNGIGSLDDQDKWGNNLLHNAVTDLMATFELIEWLADRVDINQQSKNSKTPLWRSMEALNPLLEADAIAKLLITNGSDLSGVNKDEQGLLILALRRGDISGEVIDLLLTHGVDYKQIDNKGLGAIHYSISSPLYLASLYKAGANFDEKTVGEGRTPLMLSVLEGGESQVAFLLDSNASVNEVDKTGRTALNHAIELNNTFMIDLLKESGGISNSDEVVAAATKAYEIEKARPKNLLQAIKSKDLELTKKFYGMEEDSGELNVVLAGFKSVRYGFIEGLKFLLDNDLSINDLDDGYSLLHDAAFYNQINIAEFLISEGLDPNYLNEKEGQTVFILSANSSIEMYDLLLASGMKYNVEHDGKVVSEAIRYREYDLARLYIKQGYDFDHEKFFSAEFLENKLVRKQDIKLLHFLIEHGFNIDTRFKRSFSEENLLTLSMSLEANKMIEPLLKAGINVDEYIENKSIIKIAISEGRLETVKLILKYHPGIDLNKMGGDSFDSKSNAFLESLDKGYQSMVMYFIEQDINFNQVGSFDKTALHLSAELGATEIVKKLLDKGVDHNLKDSWGKTAKTYAVINGHSDVVKLISEHNPEINLTSD